MPVRMLIALLLANELPTAQDLNAQIDRDGARVALSEMELTELFTNISSGDEAWLQIASHLATLSDGGTALMLKYSVTKALRRAPDGVLRLLKDTSVYRLLTVTSICSGEVFGPEELKDEVLSWFGASGRALLRPRQVLVVETKGVSPRATSGAQALSKRSRPVTRGSPGPELDGGESAISSADASRRGPRWLR